MRSTFTSAKLVKMIKRWLPHDGGNVSMLLGLSVLPIITVLGAAVDIERTADAQTKLQSAVDAATLYAASLSDTDDATLATKSQAFVTVNFADDKFITLTSYTLHNSGSSVVGKAKITIKTWFMGTFGFETTSVIAQSTVKKAGFNLEVSLVLDNTGSMAGTPMTKLKAAAIKFVDKVMPITQGQFYTKIAAIPYNNGVNLGSRASEARGSYLSGTNTIPGYQRYTFDNGTYTTSRNGVRTKTPKTLNITNCVTERTGIQAYTDTGFSIYPAGKSYLPDPISGTDPGNSCQVQQMVPLTTSASKLTTTINAMISGGSTAGHVGIAWGWYALSPNVGMWTGENLPAGYDKLTTTDTMAKVKKIMVLMTDGEYNSANANGVISNLPNVSGSGYSTDHINMAPTNGDAYTQSNKICAAIKESGVEVYVITFQLDKTNSKRVDLVNNCATDAAHILDADKTSLDEAFNTIANNIMTIHVAE